MFFTAHCWAGRLIVNRILLELLPALDTVDKCLVLLASLLVHGYHIEHSRDVVCDLPDVVTKAGNIGFNNVLFRRNALLGLPLGAHQRWKLLVA